MESPHSKKLWAVLIPAMLLPGLASLWYFVWLGDSPLAQVIYGSVKFFTLIWPIIATFLILKEKIFFKELSIREHLKSIPMGIMIGLPIAMVIGLLMLTETILAPFWVWLFLNEIPPLSVFIGGTIIIFAIIIKSFDRSKSLAA